MERDAFPAPQASSPPPRQPIHLVLDNIRSAFNVGSMFRTADAAGACHLHLCGMTAHPPHPRLARTALGAADHLDWTYYPTTAACVDWLEAQGITPVAVEILPGARSIYMAEWPRPMALVFGHEVRGISEDIIDRCHHRVYIPMQGFKNTLNVATACGVVLYEVARAWGAWSPSPETGKNPGFSAR